jgi:hypothetical protein
MNQIFLWIFIFYLLLKIHCLRTHHLDTLSTLQIKFLIQQYKK